MSSANCFNLDHSKILSSRNWLSHKKWPTQHLKYIYTLQMVSFLSNVNLLCHLQHIELNGILANGVSNIACALFLVNYLVLEQL